MMDGLEEEATRLCWLVNRALETIPPAKVNIARTARAIATGWDWIETTEPGDKSRTICLTQYRFEG